MADIPDKVLRFLEEYEALCRKHGCCIGSDGEEVGAFGNVSEEDFKSTRAYTARWHEKYGEQVKE